MIIQIRTLHALGFLVVDRGHIDLGFMVHLKRLLHVIYMVFLGILMHLFKKNIYYQHIRNEFLDAYAKPVPVWGKEGK